jgi:hypothetical protein
MNQVITELNYYFSQASGRDIGFAKYVDRDNSIMQEWPDATSYMRPGMIQKLSSFWRSQLKNSSSLKILKIGDGLTFSTLGSAYATGSLLAENLIQKKAFGKPSCKDRLTRSR